MRVLQVGRSAVLLEVDDVESWRVEVLSLIRQGRLPPPVEIVPGGRTLLLDGVDPAVVRALVSAVQPPSANHAGPAAATVDIDVVYDGADLAAVARLWQVDEAEVIRRHTSTEFRVGFCGFAPGFPYLLGLSDDVPRHATPRSRVPAGSVGLAGRYCGIYPTSSPGGWQLLGTTAVRLFDPRREQPALLPPSTRVHFRAVTSHPAAAPRQVADASSRRQRVLVVTRPGALTTIQDAGRPGFAHLGVPRAGFADVRSASLANRLVGNDDGAALLECTVDGVSLLARRALTVSVTGAYAPVAVNGVPAPWGVAVRVPAEGTLDVGRSVAGIRSYVAVRGGLDLSPVLGSRSGDTLSGLGPPQLQEGDELAVGTAGGVVPGVDFTVPPGTAPDLVLRLRIGPRDDWFGPAGIASLLAQQFDVSPVSNRIGVRLSGTPLARIRQGELDSEGMVLGGVQVPPDGLPVVLLADHPTTGGYPVIGVVESADLPDLAQARPGSTVRFVLSRG